MMGFLSIQYVGEHLLPGKIAHFALVLGFIACCMAVFSFYKHTQTKEDGWNTLGRISFLVHALGVFTLVGCLFYVMVNHMYEYKYAWEHTSDDLPMRYILSAFWEGQEGSFLLWMMWHIVLAGIILFNKSKWASPVACILLLIQAYTHSMILGLYIPWGEEGIRWGINPTLLLRDTMEAPIFNNAQYLAQITGNGLNELLQNYWMTIHPPIIFCGFASTSVPFAFAIAGWWTRDYKGWLRPVTLWATFSAAILGTGIIMGGAWAYEALSFGGYWAWDPVENMSLVPWLILIAGVHTNLISNATGYSIKSTYFFYILSFLMIIYSTFLTRSGILGDTSAHAFTEMGLEWQLVSLIGFFLLLGFGLYFARQKHVPTKPQEESLYSKEFWMFIGAIVLFFSAALITASSSLPVYNAIMEYFDPTFVGNVIEDPIPHYNKYQLWVAVFMSILSGFAVFTRFRSSTWSKEFVSSLIKSQTLTLLGAGVLTYLATFWISYFELRYAILTFFLMYCLLSSLYYIIRKAIQKTKMAAASLSHFGFALMIFGTVTSGLNTRTVSTNPFAMKGLLADESLNDVVTLIKGEPMYTPDYWITYQKDTVDGRYRYFDILFEKVGKDSTVIESFKVHPNVQYDKKFSKIAASNPSTKHYLTRDIFTNIASLPRSQMDIELAKEVEDSLDYYTYTGSIGDTLITKKHFAIIKEVTFDPSHPDVHMDSLSLALGVVLEVGDMESNETKTIIPTIGLRENTLFEFHGINDHLGIKAVLDQSVFRDYFDTEDELRYESFMITEGGGFEFNDYVFTLNKISKEIDHKDYIAEEGDIAISALLDIKGPDFSDQVNPVYFIRDSRPLNVKAYSPKPGLHVRFVKVNPTTGEFEFMIAQDSRVIRDMTFNIAEDVPRSDIIILEAKEFPGINLFWLGSILMIVGFVIALFQRKKKLFKP